MDHFPAYSSLLAFTPEALRNWGQAHENHSEQTLQFHTQLHEWKCTKQDLCTILGKAYEETQVLKEHVISNDVTQEHLYMLHIQVKRTALQVRDMTHDIDQLISVTLKQMTLNVEVVRDFGTVLHAIPYDMLEIHDFYHSTRSFYIRLMDRLVNKYKKNNPFIINITHSFESFCQGVSKTGSIHNVQAPAEL